LFNSEDVTIFAAEKENISVQGVVKPSKKNKTLKQQAK